MPWNYRIMRHVKKNLLFGRTPKKITPDADWTPEPFPEFVTWYAIHECYYNKGEDTPYAWSVDPIDVSADESKDIAHKLEMMLEATKKPILDYDMAPAKRKYEPETEGGLDAGNEV